MGYELTKTFLVLVMVATMLWGCMPDEPPAYEPDPKCIIESRYEHMERVEIATEWIEVLEYAQSSELSDMVDGLRTSTQLALLDELIDVLDAEAIEDAIANAEEGVEDAE